jgi:hypothetical protein
MIASTALRTFAAAEWPNLNHKGRLRELVRLLPTWRPRRVRSVYNAEQGVSLRAEEASDIEALTEEARNEYRDLAQLANSLHALLYGPEADFYRPQVDAIRAALVPASSPVSAGGGDAGPRDQGREG